MPSPPHAIPSNASLSWRPTKIMNMRDLSVDDDFLSHLLVEKLGTGAVPLHVHKMDGSRRLPKTDARDLMAIVRRLVVAKGPLQHVVRQAVDELLLMSAIRYYLKSYTQQQINAFATHASRYFELYHPSGSIEIAHTSRYSHRTGKSELCILATRVLTPGTVITELKGSMANLTDEEDKELKRTGMKNCDIRRDFSVIHSKQMKKNHLFLGPARFVNHDCDNNCELFREGKYITFRVLRRIDIGEEITAHYGDGYFGKKNRHCLCETCEKRGRGGYAPDHLAEDPEPSSDSSSDDSDTDSDSSSSESESEDAKLPVVNLNERRTRRGVYATVTKEEESDESENEDDNKVPLANATDIPADRDMEMSTEVDSASELTSLTPSEGLAPSQTLLTPSPAPAALSRKPSSSLSSLSTDAASVLKSVQTPSSHSTISTQHQQKAKYASVNATKPANTPSVDNTPSKRITRSVSSLLLSGKKDSGKGKGKSSATPGSTPGRTVSGALKKEGDVEDVKVKKEEVEARVLRTRPFATAPVQPSKESIPKEKEIPRGQDGKPLPVCSTCSNVLPVIAVDSKVVWGLGLDNSKKKQKMECPRCMRHFAIYQQPWPSRIAPHGSAHLTPREETTPMDVLTKRVSLKALPVLDKKLAAAASASTSKGSLSKKRERTKNEKAVEERPSKKRKSEPEPVTPEISSKTKKVGGSAKTYRSPSPELARKRGRPRLSSPRSHKSKGAKIRVKVNMSVSAPVIIKVEEAAPEVPKQPPSQPRSTNGRFGKKDRGSRKEGSQNVSPRAERAAERMKLKEKTERQEGQVGDVLPTRTSPRNKNNKGSRSDGTSSLDSTPTKTPKSRATVIGDAMDVDVPEQLERVLRRGGFRGGGLFSKPNPMNFALHPWRPVVDDSSSEDEKAPVTPEEQPQSPAAEIVDATELDSTLLICAPTIARVSSIYKPNPLTFAKAKQRLATMSASPLTPSVPAEKSFAYVRPSREETDGEMSDVSPDDLLLSDGYPSGLEEEETPRLKHLYPAFSPGGRLGQLPNKTTTAFVVSESNGERTSKPRFFNAGWP